MKHCECANYLSLDCEKGMCDADKYGIGNCSGFEKENWTYALNGSFCCEHYQQR